MGRKFSGDLLWIFIINFIFPRCSYKKAISCLSWLEFAKTHRHGFLIDNCVQHCYVLFSYAFSLKGKYVHVYEDIFMTMYSFVPPFCEAKFCDVSECVFDKLGCVAGQMSRTTFIVSSGQEGSREDKCLPVIVVVCSLADVSL